MAILDITSALIFVLYHVAIPCNLILKAVAGISKVEEVPLRSISR
jgi:hypothetical protein